VCVVEGVNVKVSVIVSVGGCCYGCRCVVVVNVVCEGEFVCVCVCVCVCVIIESLFPACDLTYSHERHIAAKM